MTLPIDEYTVCQGDSPLQLTKSVMLAIRDGWQPHGPMVIDPIPPRVFYQPMVRYQEIYDGEGQ